MPSKDYLEARIAQIDSTLEGTYENHAQMAGAMEGQLEEARRDLKNIVQDMGGEGDE